LGDRPAAIRELRRAEALNPDDPSVHRLLGRALDDDGNLAAAIVQYDQYLRLDADNAQVHCDLGSALADVGNLPEAIVHYRRALQIDPHLSAAQEGLRRAQQQLQRGRP
jgi:superkiller protein 3